MIKISAADVNKLRQQTGAGMMDCKKALEESNGDFEVAIDYLRKKGQKVAAKRAGKEASEGFVIAATNPANNFGMALMLNCETDFVAKSEDFVRFANKVKDVAVERAPRSIDQLRSLEIEGRKISDHISDLMGKIGEKIDLAEYEAIEAQYVAAYNHMGNRLATLCGLNKKTGNNIPELAKELAMQVAAMSPIAVDKDDVDAKTIEKEIEIGKEQARQEGKPEAMLEKIALGKLNKFYKESTLLNQDFVRDTKKTVRQYLAENDKDLTVTDFKRISLS